MLAWLRRLGRRAQPPPPLTGAPAVRRLKTYSAASGYVYQYFYEGHRGTEYVFQVSADRQTYSSVSVLLTDAAIEASARELNATERYAVAKMALFQAFDERARPDHVHEPIRVEPRDLAAIAEHLEFL
jgi:hypothetical protein